ncbi:MAG: YggS family pyridoxal phosphate-dependent enzyme [Ruminococcus sp.]|nr:YggS family pyridoxal phosphate-dependent enzyme [Ruminococcus sp.]
MTVDYNSVKFQNIVENIKEICYNISVAKEKYRKSDEIVKIMAVTKTVEPDIVNIAVNEGITLLGENRVQEYLSKKDFYDKRADVHFIGHLQTNKVKYIINDVSVIQSVDSFKLAQEINKQALKNNKVMDILVEINIGGEISKSGIDKLQVIDLVEQISQLENIKIKGLMTIPPPMCSENVFDEMHSIFLDVKNRKISNVKMDILSMGMSGDYETAIKHGSNLVRIGTKLFGARNYMEVT